MPVRVFFRGLVLFRFPTAGNFANRLVAELISEPDNRPPNAKVPKGQDDHQAEIQVATGEDVEELLNNKKDIHHIVPRRLDRGADVLIDISPSATPTADPRHGATISRAASFDAHVPKLSRLAGMTAQQMGPPAGDDRRYLRNRIIVNRGQIRVKDVVIWDGGGFPLAGAPGAIPSPPAHIKFMGVAVEGNAANECVVEAEGTDIVEVTCHEQPRLNRKYESTRNRNQRAQEGTTDILIRNYEYQRAKPVPWGLDFQWLFARLGYRPVNLESADNGEELRAFRRDGDAFDPALFRNDSDSLLPTRDGYPFPYVWFKVPYRELRRIHPSNTPATDIDSRPVCVPGDE